MTVSYPGKILVAGATGGAGTLVVRRLHLLEIPVRVLTRDRRRAGPLGDVEIIEGDVLNRDHCGKAVAGCDAVICTLGDRTIPRGRAIVDGDGIIHLVAAAVDAGVKRFVLVSSLGVGDGWRRLPFFMRWFFQATGLVRLLQEKARSEDYLKTSGLDWVILRPGGFINRKMRAEPLLTAGGLVPGLTTRQAVADVAVRCLASQNAAGKVLTVVNRWLRFALWGGKEFALDVPWQRW
jgi:uncharacterized protein YbjT (DUF2867 family)